MESGVKVGAQGLVAQNPSADAALSVRTGAAAAAKEKPKDEIMMIGGSSPAPAKPAETKTTVRIKIPREEAEMVGKTVIATWAADGQKYAATVLRNVGLGKVEVQFNGYPDKASVMIKDIVLKK
eukprot:TRINITY_DN305_c0_g2_i2.p1 TRINITY_DN305_c0_g2~~TRINITY_DN305_c0_g2_i2.p1  ORF type:complete len:124 (-),score=35.14 TRINITY_DN305_c0_g2_i2:120-491(-)